MRLTPVIALIGALALGSCGGTTSSTTSGAVSQRATSQSPSGTTSSATASAGGPNATASSATAGAATTVIHHVPGRSICRASHLRLSFLGQQGATGHGELGFKLQNVGAGRCSAVGYPGVLFLGRGGQPLPTVPSHSTHDFFGVTPLAHVVVAPGASFSFRLGVTHGAASTVGCTTAYGVQVIAPNDTATLRVTIPEGAYECRTVTVSPVRPGTSAYP
jgi:hypothetical protein